MAERPLVAMSETATTSSPPMAAAGNSTVTRPTAKSTPPPSSTDASRGLVLLDDLDLALGIALDDGGVISVNQGCDLVDASLPDLVTETPTFTVLFHRSSPVNEIIPFAPNIEDTEMACNRGCQPSWGSAAAEIMMGAKMRAWRATSVKLCVDV